MISREETVDRTNGALGDLYQALAGLHEQRAKYGSKGVQIMGEPIVSEILKLRKEIDDLIGLAAYVSEYGVPPTDEETDATAPAAPQAAPAASGPVRSEDIKWPSHPAT
jgi:hypothetical protein